MCAEGAKWEWRCCGFIWETWKLSSWERSWKWEGRVIGSKEIPRCSALIPAPKGALLLCQLYVSEFCSPLKLAAPVLLGILERCSPSVCSHAHLLTTASLGVGMGLHSWRHRQGDRFSELLELNIPRDSWSLPFRELLSCGCSHCCVPHGKARLLGSLLRPS